MGVPVRNKRMKEIPRNIKKKNVRMYPVTPSCMFWLRAGSLFYLLLS